MFAPAWATEDVCSSDVMDNIGEMFRRTDVNGAANGSTAMSTRHMWTRAPHGIGYLRSNT
jgi:hypothetical protein